MVFYTLQKPNELLLFGPDVIHGGGNLGFGVNEAVSWHYAATINYKTPCPNTCNYPADVTNQFLVCNTLYLSILF